MSIICSRYAGRDAATAKRCEHTADLLGHPHTSANMSTGHDATWPDSECTLNMSGTGVGITPSCMAASRLPFACTPRNASGSHRAVASCACVAGAASLGRTPAAGQSNTGWARSPDPGPGPGPGLDPGPGPNAGLGPGLDPGPAQTQAQAQA
eukprot:269426-Chlamydomonas_euryale.AAC.1